MRTDVDGCAADVMSEINEIWSFVKSKLEHFALLCNDSSEHI